MLDRITEKAQQDTNHQTRKSKLKARTGSEEGALSRASLEDVDPARFFIA